MKSSLSMHFLYWIVIAALLGLLSWREATRIDRAFTTFLLNNLEASQAVTQTIHERLRDEVQRTTNGYPTADNRHYRDRADHISVSGRRLDAQLADMQDELRDGATPAVDSLEHGLQRFADTLQMLTDGMMPPGNFYFVANSPKAGEMDFSRFMRRAGRSEIDLFLQVRRFQLAYNIASANNYFSQRVSGKQLREGSYYVPVLSARRSALQIGERYVADLFLASYSMFRDDSISIMVNGRVLPVKDGHAHFEETFRQPGLKNLDCEIVIHNRKAGTVRKYPKTFECLVLPPCRE